MVRRPTARRIPLGLLVSALLWTGFGVGAFAFVRSSRHVAAPTSRVHALQRPGTFSHIYPPDPAPFERPAVGTSSPIVPSTYRVPTGRSISSIGALAKLMPPRTLGQTRTGAWILRHPVELTAYSSLVLSGPLAIDIAPGAFLLAEQGALIQLTGVTLVGTTLSGTPETRPLSSRGFLDARNGARVVLRNDSFTDLGHLGDQAYGLTLDGASSASTIVGCTFQSDYFGIYLARLSGGSVTGNHFLNSLIYGIDPHTYDSNLVISGNYVAGSGVHGIVLADHVTHNKVIGNIITSSRDHGIVLDQFANANILEHNRITGTFDGIVIKDSSTNLIAYNSIARVSRFGLRISGLSNHNVALDNTFSGGIVNAYLYQGATGNKLVGNTFRGPYENVRIRSDASRNTVTPLPQRSEI